MKQALTTPHLLSMATRTGIETWIDHARATIASRTSLYCYRQQHDPPPTNRCGRGVIMTWPEAISNIGIAFAAATAVVGFIWIIVWSYK